VFHAEEIFVVHLAGLDVDVVAGGLVEELEIARAGCFRGSEGGGSGESHSK